MHREDNGDSGDEDGFSVRSLFSYFRLCLLANIVRFVVA
jgi:hypothetical protein